MSFCECFFVFLSFIVFLYVIVYFRRSVKRFLFFYERNTIKFVFLIVFDVKGINFKYK